MPYTDDGLDSLQTIEWGDVKKAPFDNERIRSDTDGMINSLRQKTDQYQYEAIRLESIKQRVSDIGISHQISFRLCA